MESSERPPVAPLLLSAIATLFFIESLRVFFASIYFFNLTSLGINATVLYALLLVAPLVYWGHWRPSHVPGLFAASIAMLAGARVAMSLAWSTPRQLPWAGLSAAAYLVLLPAALSITDRRGRDAIAIGAALGWALDAGIVVVGRSVDLSTLPSAWPVLTLLGVGLVALGAVTLAAPRQVVPPSTNYAPGPARLAGLGIGAWFFLEHAILPPHVLSRWNGIGLGTATLMTITGVLVASALALRPTRVPPQLLLGLNGLAIAAFFDDGFVHSRFLPFLMFAAQVALVLDIILLTRTVANAPFPRIGRMFLATAGMILAFHFAFAFAFTFAFVPFKNIWQHGERIIPLLAMALVLLGTFTNRERPAARSTPLAAMPRVTLAALLILPAILGVWGLSLESAPVTTPPSDRIVIATYNVHQGFNGDGAIDAGIYEAVLKELDADIIALQESDTTRFTSSNLDIVHLLATRLGYHAYGGPATNEQSVGIALLSRYPIHEARSLKLPTTSDNRYVLEARLEIGGQDVWIYGTHMGLKLPDREWQTDAILDLATRSPRILLGDFNSCPEGICPDFNGPDDTIYQKLTATHTDAWVAAGHAPTDPAGWTYPTLPAPIERIDHIYVDEQFIVVDARVEKTDTTRRASDHWPLVTTLRLRNP